MTLPQHLVPTLEGVTTGSVVEVSGEEAHHAVVVRRLRVGEQVRLCDGAGVVAVGCVAETGKRRFSVAVSTVEAVDEPQPRLTAVQALPKGDRGELAVEMLTEIGVARIVPWAADRSVAVWKGERAVKSHAKWAATAREASKQARRPWAPVVAPLAATADVVAVIEAADLAVVLHEDAAGSLADVDLPDQGDVVIVIGPEGGLTSAELEAFAAAGATEVRLGREVLRTSTAGVAAAAALLARTPRWC